MQRVIVQERFEGLKCTIISFEKIPFIELKLLKKKTYKLTHLKAEQSGEKPWYKKFTNKSDENSLNDVTIDDVSNIVKLGKGLEKSDIY